MEIPLMANSRRKTKRYIPKRPVFASLGSKVSQVGKVFDIGLEGLSFSLIGDKEADLKSTHVDIFTLDEEFTLSGLPCALIHQTVENLSGLKKGSENNLIYRKCGLKFNALSRHQSGRLSEFLAKNTTVEEIQLRDTPRREEHIDD
jgi:hypothetical protein